MMGRLLVKMAHESIHTGPMVLWMEYIVLNLGKVAAAGTSSLNQEHWKIDYLPKCLVYLGCLVVGTVYLDFTI